ncbi:porin [Geomonas sp. Red32]|uniref:porin n=1 Tax=Geomonas sp. Red32 TaxID=2912856 RepID=UPI00202CCC7A|nr:porin [Geomonas sp. Red32]MCM0083317.1 porin [Geomonas sp. Red32]
MIIPQWLTIPRLRRPVVPVSLFLACTLVLLSAGPLSAQPPEELSEYHTPLAGEAREVPFMGHWVAIPSQDRRRLTCLTLGGTVLEPRQGSLGGLPIGALFLRRADDTFRTRDVISIFENELEYDRRFGTLELVTHFQNYTLPGDITEIANNREMKATAATYGWAVGAAGPGIRIPVAPGGIDNNLKFQLLGRIGYFYAERSHGTGPDVVIPPDTLLYGARLRARYDGLTRNLLELPHRGVALGLDADYLHRDRWRSLEPAGGEPHHDFQQLRGYLVAAGGLPGLSEKNRLLVNLNAGATSSRDGDRFNAFLVEGGPLPSEEDDLVRSHYGGIIYDQVRATDYASGSLSYRRELAFFLYLSLTGSYIWGQRATVEGADVVTFRPQTGKAATISLDSAFFWNSEVYLAYGWESGFIRDGRSGHGVTLLWNKSW